MCVCARARVRVRASVLARYMHVLRLENRIGCLPSLLSTLPFGDRDSQWTWLFGWLKSFGIYLSPPPVSLTPTPALCYICFLSWAAFTWVLGLDSGPSACKAGVVHCSISPSHSACILRQAVLLQIVPSNDAALNWWDYESFLHSWKGRLAGEMMRTISSKDGKKMAKSFSSLGEVCL